MAGITLRIAWLYREKGAEVEEQRFISIARNSISSIRKAITLEHKCPKPGSCI